MDDYFFIFIICTIISAFMASLTAKMGIIYSLSKENISNKAIFSIIGGLATGAMLSAVFMFLWPFSFKSIQSLGTWSLIGLMIFLSLDRYLNNFVDSSEEQCEKKSINGAKIYFCQIIFNLSYGVALSVGFKMGFIKGIVIATGIILYQFPKSIHNLNTLKNNWSLRSAIIGVFLSPFTIPIGAAVTLFILYAPIVPSSSIGPVFGITAGILIYLGISDIIRRTDLYPSSIAYGIGAVAVLLIRILS